MLGPKSAGDPEEEFGQVLRTYRTATGVVWSKKVRVVSATAAWFVIFFPSLWLDGLMSCVFRWRGFYNHTFLRTIPLIGITVGRLMFIAMFQLIVNGFLLAFNPEVVMNFRRPAYIALVFSFPFPYLHGFLILLLSQNSAFTSCLSFGGQEYPSFDRGERL